MRRQTWWHRISHACPEEFSSRLNRAGQLALQARESDEMERWKGEQQDIGESSEFDEAGLDRQMQLVSCW
jgi:hypothetical protein